MPQDVTAATIALIGVLASTVISLITSMRVTNTEMKKLRMQIQQTYAGKLLEKRLETYPDLYRHLSGFVKTIEFNAISKASLQELRTHIETWDTKHSLLFGGYTTDLFHEFRVFLAQLSEMSEEDLQRKFSSQDEKRALLDRIAEVELALKGDLGMWLLENPDDPRIPRTYREVEKRVKQNGNS